MGTKNVELVLAESSTRGTVRLAMIILAHRASDKADASNYRTTWTGEERLARDAGMSVSNWRKTRQGAARSGEIITYDRRAHRLTNVTFFVLGLSEDEIVELLSTVTRFKFRGVTKDDGSVEFTPKGKEFIPALFSPKTSHQMARRALALQAKYRIAMDERDNRLTIRGRSAAASK